MPPRRKIRTPKEALAKKDGTPRKRVGPPKGSQNALGNKSRPSIYNLDEQAINIMEWANRPNTSHLVEFAREVGITSLTLLAWRDKHEGFKEAYQYAKDSLNLKLRAKIETPQGKLLNPALLQRDVSHYDAILRDDERKEKVFESKLKQKEAKEVGKNLKEVATLSRKGKLKQK